MQDYSSIMKTLPWQSISGQITSCEHIPDAILNLSSDDPHVRKIAYWKVDNYVVVQGGLYEGAFYVTPFLLEAVMSDLPEGKLESTNLLFEIANGAARLTQSSDSKPFVFPSNIMCQILMVP